MIDPKPGDEGRGVIYWKDSRALEHGIRSVKVLKGERGVVSSWNDKYVFVRYTSGSTAAATRRENLEWEL